MELFLPCLYGALASLAFCVVFELRNPKYMLLSSLIGFVGWLVYLLLESHSGVTRFFFATIVSAALAEIMARRCKAPATIFLIAGIIPLVPGGGMYYTMEALINGNMLLFAEKALETAAAAGAMAVGCSLVTSVTRILTVWRRNRQQTN